MMIQTGISLLLISFASLAAIGMPCPAGAEDDLRLAPWYQDREGASTLRFDDGDESHITTVIPMLGQYAIRATFMINPGKRSYREHKDVWEHQVPALGHRLGNHTMNHHGARNIEEAIYEIGEAAQVIQRVHVGETKLMVFASGGGAKWGGADWEHASPEYRDLVARYYLIDLYDGKHTSHLINGSSTVEGLCSLIDAAVTQKQHQPFHAHRVGPHTLIDYIKSIRLGTDLVVPTTTLKGLLECLSDRRDKIWVAPLIDVLKYTEESRASSLIRVSAGKGSTTWKMKIATDPILYDHPLTLVLPSDQQGTLTRVTQDRIERAVYRGGRGQFLVDVTPVDSVITLHHRTQ